VRIKSFTNGFQEHTQTAAGLPLHRSFGASPHADGGAFYDVTHSQRKYHLRSRFMASSFAKAACGAGVDRSVPVKPPFMWDDHGAPAA